MLASLAINLLSVCAVMMAIGWAYDFVQASVFPGGRDARFQR
jgi:hypothetical protein